MVQVAPLARSGPHQCWVVLRRVAALKDINAREALILCVLAIAVLGLGIWPAPLTNIMHVSVENLLQHMSISKL